MTAQVTPERRYDILIRGGSVLDGTGSPPVFADIGIAGDTIVDVGVPADVQASVLIDARGLRVVPGFIDIHTHSDISVTFHGEMLSMISQGVTTQVVGNCALSLGMALDTDDFTFERRWLAGYDRKIVWRDMSGHLRHVADIGTATNYVMLAGHGTIRKRVMGLADRPAEASEIAAMQRLLAEALEAGAWGLSTGLEYTPSGYANLDELVALSKTAAKYGAFYATHLRNEGDALIDAVQEALDVGARAGIAVQLSHHKAEGRQNWGKVRRTIEMIEDARGRGIDVQMDQYPYTAYMTNIGVQCLPMWVMAGSTEDTLGRLRDGATRARIAAEMLRDHPDWSEGDDDGPWGRVTIAVARTDRSLQGKTVAAIARERNCSPVDAVLDVVLSEGNFVSAVNFALDEDDVCFVMRHPWTMIGSDAVGTGPDGRTGQDRVHPRCYGTFPRVLGRYVRDAGAVAEAEAVRKMTSLPAGRLGIRDRGRIAPGCRADIVVYDADRIADTATFDDPHQYASGIEYVLVNGRVVWRDGWTGVLPGSVLRKERPGR